MAFRLVSDFLRQPDPDREDYLHRARRQYAAHMHKPELLNEGSPWEEPLTVELALAYGERLAAEVLA